MVHEDVAFGKRCPEIAMRERLFRRMRQKARVAQPVEAREVGEGGEEGGAERPLGSVDVHVLNGELLLEEVR